jgi:phosphopentomutase
MSKRIFLIVLDSLGIGELPDALFYGDSGANTLKCISKSKYFNIPNLLKMGIGNIDGITYLKTSFTPAAAYARLREGSLGKDTTIGHWEIAGIISEFNLPTYPNGFPENVINKFVNCLYVA